MSWFRKLFCFHSSWAKAGWKPLSARQNQNWWVCKDCGKLKNFEYRTIEGLSFAEFPINFDCSNDTLDKKDSL